MIKLNNKNPHTNQFIRIYNKKSPTLKNIILKMMKLMIQINHKMIKLVKKEFNLKNK